MYLSATGIILLTIGVVCIAFNEALTKYLIDMTHAKDETESPLLISSGTELNTTIINQQSDKPWAEGIAWAVVTGACGGSVLVPMHYAPAYAQGLAFIPSFGTGAIIAAPVIAAIFFIYEGAVPYTHWRICLPVGLVSGTLFNISNSLAIVAIPSLGYAVAYPILQCALFVAGVWGIVAFEEIKGSQIVVFFGSGLVLLGGAVSIAVAA